MTNQQDIYFPNNIFYFTKMEFNTRKAVKYILTTYDDGKTNKLYDSTFRLRPPFKPNSNGNYKVTINECLFQNNEPTLTKDVDYMEFTIYLKNGIEYRNKFVVQKDLYTFDNKCFAEMLKCIKYYQNETTNIKCVNFNPMTIYIATINLYNSDTGTVLPEDAYPQNIKMEILLSKGTVFNINDVSKVSLKTSSNYAYLLNNMNAEIFGELNSDGDGFDFYFHNLRLGGPYLYVLKTPLQATVPTYNVKNQGYNVVACCYNSNGYHNSNTQMCSSMELVTDNLSDFRIELVNDQYDPVKIHTPLYLQITVSNE